MARNSITERVILISEREPREGWDARSVIVDSPAEPVRTLHVVPGAGAGLDANE